VILQHRTCRLFDLEEEGVVSVSPLEQHDVGARPNAADADHLARNVHDSKALEEIAPSSGTVARYPWNCSWT